VLRKPVTVMNQIRETAILIFDDVEVLDFCGPFEVFAVTGNTQSTRPFHVYTIAEKPGPIIARNGLSVNPNYTLAECPAPDILLVPGGQGTRREMHNTNLTNWIREQAEPAELVLSVCTGALLLAGAGLLDNLEATTHHNALELLREVAPNTRVDETKRFVDNGKIVLSAGISAGIDMSLHIVERLLGHEEAVKTAWHMEYDWRPADFEKPIR
jgi:transcriptional regulator GlxA family with amidase domain